MTTDPETPTARDLLAAALHEAKRGNAGNVWVDDIERTPSGRMLLARADEARVAGGLSADRLWDAIGGIGTLHGGAWVTFSPEDAERIAALYNNLPAPRPPEPDRCSECGVPIAEHPPTDACAIAQESRPPEPDRTAALVERLAARQCEASAWYDLPDDGVSRCMDPEYNEEEPAICAPCEARAALAATPEPAPVADQCSVCGWRTSDAGVSVSVRDHMTIAHGLPAPVADGTVEGCQFPECPLPDSNGWHAATPGGPIASRFDHPFTPTPPTDGAA